jgi:hypothetical protein
MQSSDSKENIITNRRSETFVFPSDIRRIGSKTPLPLKFRDNNEKTGFIIYPYDTVGFRGYKVVSYSRKRIRNSIDYDYNSRFFQNLYFEDVETIWVWMHSYMRSNNDNPERYRLQFIGSKLVKNLYVDDVKSESFRILLCRIGSILVD